MPYITMKVSPLDWWKEVPDLWNHQIKGLILQRKGSGMGICDLGYESQIIKWEQLRELYTVIWGQLWVVNTDPFPRISLCQFCDQRNHKIEGVDSVETFLKGQTKGRWQKRFKNHRELLEGWLLFYFLATELMRFKPWSVEGNGLERLQLCLLTKKPSNHKQTREREKKKGFVLERVVIWTLSTYQLAAVLLELDMSSSTLTSLT